MKRYFAPNSLVSIIMLSISVQRKCDVRNLPLASHNTHGSQNKRGHKENVIAEVLYTQALSWHEHTIETD